MSRLFGFVIGLMLLAGCGGEQPSDITADNLGVAQEVKACFGASRINVMTHNMYVGASLDPVIGATDPAQIPLLAAQAWQIMVANKIEERAAAIADEVWFARPHLIGLQEVSLLRTQTPGDSVIGGTVPATEVAFDYLAILMDELAARGLNYNVAAQVQNFDAELPRINPDYSFTDVRLTDFDVILARDDVVTTNAVGANYNTYLPVPGIPVYRGWAAVDAKVKGTTFRVVTTHLESAHPQVRMAQAQELTMILAAETRPLVVFGDFNSIAPQGTAYQMMLGAGYTDVWAQRVGWPSDGFTCCQAEDLSNAQSLLDQRIDFIFFRNFTAKVVLAWTTGDKSWSITDSGLWPSDHAGLVSLMIH